MRLIPLILAALLVGFAFPLNNQILDARFDQLDAILARSVVDADEVPASLAILVRFELVRRRSDAGESDLESYQLEARLMTLVSSPQFETLAPETAPVPRNLYRQALFKVSRALVGLPDDSIQSRPWLLDLERAFLYERVRRYQQAIKAYEELLVTADLEPSTAAMIELHRAFCLAMSAEPDRARAAVRSILDRSPGDTVTSIAQQILEFLQFVETRRTELLASDLDEVDMARGLYFATEFERSEAILESFVTRRTGDPRESEARYYLGRSREEMGDAAGALREYIRVSLLDPSGHWAIESMRRVMVLASLYYTDFQLAEDARNELVRLNDQAFTDIVDPYRDILSDMPRVAGPELGWGSDEGQAPAPELFVRTVPSGARISVEGIDRGISPLFIEGIRPGPVVVEAVMDDYRGIATVDVRDGEITSLFLTLGRRFGALELRTSLTDVLVYMDETSSYTLDSPALERIPPGHYFVLIEGSRADGKIVLTEQEIIIRPDDVTILEIELE